MSKETISRLILFFLIPLQLFLFTFLVPPFQKPDEQPHFEKSLLISKSYLFCQKKSNNTVKLEKKYVDFIKNPYLDLMTHGKNTKLPLPVFFKDLFSNNQSSKKIDFNIDHLCSFPIISYLPQAFALLITSTFNLNPILSLYFGRLVMSILSYFWFLYLYRKIADDYKLILLFTFSLPMTLHQISSFSYDVIHIMLALTFFGLIINYRIKKRVDFWQYFKLFFVLFLFLSSKKIGYETFFLFLFLIPFEIKPMIISSLIFIPFYFLSKLSGSYDLQYSLTNQIINPLQQLSFLLSNPINIIKVVTITTIQRLSFYLQSLIGIFGWLEYGLDPLSYLLYGLFFVYLLININLPKKYKLSNKKNFLLFGALSISYIFIVLLAYVFNTVPGTLIAHGVQGRYFIPFLPFIILFVIQIKNNSIFQKILYWLIIMFLISATFYSIFNRYY
ncbi:MAG: Membrane protein [Candidatus Roizmanbacteria bacterium GW2011_GWA2_32_13]|uniref:Membrane protein n=1 Tax=Candidatus Roizmanbacteria bacterium GW2011_GWA2_32_13 TaxID=1618475 RepID=A0A0F9YZ91_9BACT|nr:MAG: Membrane protein [Candidatus Roizmanbacteria bacterium GW2011_GWA2_32_13]